MSDPAFRDHMITAGVLVMGLLALLYAVAFAQPPTQINLTTQAKGAYAIPSGPLSAMPLACTVGQQYMALDQPLGQQVYLCSLNPGPVYMQQLNLGGSGALVVTGGSLDVNPAIVPLTFH